jgi:hypothetical protein
LARAAPIAVAGAALNGLITGTVDALVPAWMQSENLEQATIGLFMLTAVLGGPCKCCSGRPGAQYDKGKRWSRRSDGSGYRNFHKQHTIQINEICSARCNDVIGGHSPDDPQCDQAAAVNFLVP